jgi:GNAT superfamily N-acetyltransferase
MTNPPAAAFVLRDFDPAREADFDWVALGMHLTLVDVEGEKGRETYSLAWARTRLREMLDRPHPFDAKAFLAVALDDPAVIGGHTILRLNTMPDGRVYGLVSTTYVDPSHRRAGLADRLLDRGEAWLLARGMTESATWTSSTNVRLIRLYEKHGYAITESGPNGETMMVRLTKALPVTS